MALTPAENQKRYRERLKEKKKQANLAAFEVFKQPFFEFLGDSSTSFEECLAMCGIEAPWFEDDRGPRHFALNGVLDDVTDDVFDDSVRSLGRAEIVIDGLIDAAADLADHINRYKRQEIKARLAEIEASDLSDPETKKAALKNVTRLNKMLDQLDKQVRWTFPQWKVTG